MLSRSASQVRRLVCHPAPGMNDVHLHGVPVLEEFHDLDDLPQGHASRVGRDVGY